jgi:class 3 adenylate cyclase/tetratricopeptide (TPR) repeat protein
VPVEAAAERPEAVAGLGREPRAAERRLVSVLFADLVGFTSLSESRDAEEVRELLSRYFDTCRRLIGLYGGTVEKFIGDAVMAVWGTPTATEDDAERAVRAALDLVTAVSALGDEIGASQLRARAGVLTGEAAVTLGATGEGMVAGDLVNTASRIQAEAPPGAVYVGEATRRATELAVVYEDSGSHELKGKDGLVPLWRAMRVVSGARGSLKAEGLEAPFVGRERELRLIKDLFHGCVEERSAHLVSITGIAGHGKSRLLWEFYKYFDGLPQVTYWHRGRCLSYGEGVTYWALADMVRMRARIAEDDESAVAQAKLRETLEEHIADEEELRFVEPRLAHLLGLEDRIGREREDLFAAWRIFFERLAETYPTVMVFEDLQWADASLLDFIEYLQEWSRNHPLFVLTLARPELTDRRPTWGAGKRNFTSFYLEPLSEGAMEGLLAGLVPGLPGELRARILERAEGVPLYAVETVRMLLDRGLLAQEGPVYRPTREIETLEVPETLQALIAARLDGLGQEERHLLQDGAVFGKTFTKQALSALSGIAEEELERSLASLVRKEVLSIQADPRSPEHGQYGFLQDLVKHVAYETLSRRDRRTKHLAAAAYLELAFAEDEVVEVAASHYLEAYRAAPDEDDAWEIKAQALAMLTRAGERASSLAAGAEAQRYFEQAAELADDELPRAELLERAGETAFVSGRITEAEALFEQALTLFEGAGATHPAARASSRLGEVDWATGRHDRALKRMTGAYRVLAADEPDEDFATLAAQLGRVHWFKGEMDAATGYVNAALDAAEKLRLPEVLSQVLNTFGAIAISQEHAEHSLALIKHALAVALENDLPTPTLRAYINLGESLSRRDRYEEALATYETGIVLARKVGNNFWEWQLLSEMGYCLGQTGHWDEALARINEIPEAQQREATIYLGSLTTLPEIQIARGNNEAARELLAVAPSFERASDLQYRGCFMAAKARVALAEGRPDEALQTAEATIIDSAPLGPSSQPVRHAYVSALEAAFVLPDHAKVDELVRAIEGLKPGVQPHFLRAQASRFRARLAATSGDDEQVAQGFNVAADVFREFTLPFWLAVVQLEHGEWLAATGRSEEAEPLHAEARGLFEQLGATIWLERMAGAQSWELTQAPV